MVRLQLPPAPPVLRDGVIRNSSLFESEVNGANPFPAANFPPGGEIESRLAYTQKSEGQNLSGRPMPRCIIRSAPVSETGGPGAKPGEAANFRRRAQTSTKNKHLSHAKRSGRVQTLYERHTEQDDCAGPQPQLAGD